MKIMNTGNSDSSSPSLLEELMLKLIKQFPIRKGKERIVDYFRKFLSLSEGTMRQAIIDNNVPIFVDIFERIQSYMYFIGEYERHETRKFIHCVKPEDVVLDLGANIGYFSLIASKLVGEKGHIFSFEASPKVYELLCKNCSLSNKNISHFNLAVADKEGILRFNLPRNPKEQGSGSLSTDNSGDIEVRGISIDRFVQTEKITKLNFIKMDIEGAEVKALLGMKETIFKYRPKILFEFSPSRYDELEISQFNSLVKLMKDLSYKFKFLTRNGEWLDVKSFPEIEVSTIFAEIDSKI
jgi:FkbM family methyltransferase